MYQAIGNCGVSGVGPSVISDHHHGTIITFKLINQDKQLEQSIEAKPLLLL